MVKKLSRKRFRNRSRTGGASALPVDEAPNKETFAARLGAYMLESVHKDAKIQFDAATGFSEKVPQVFGILPFLHLNISEEDFKESLENGESENSHLRQLCLKKGLDKLLEKVHFKCEDQIKTGFKSLNDGLIYSINNKFESRINGQKHLQEILNYQKIQRQTEKIPKESILWSEGFDNKSEVVAPVETKSWWPFW